MKRKKLTPALAISDMTVERNSNFRLLVPRLTVLPGRVACVVGANGCGKTTLLETVMGLLLPKHGVVEVAGQRTTTFEKQPFMRRVIGFVPDDDEWIIPELTAHEYVLLLAEIYKKAGIVHDLFGKAQEVARILQFTQFDQQIGSLSHGNKKKVQLIAGLIHCPRLLVVDELRNGLDPIAIKQAEELLVIQKESGAAILAATHDLWWAERFADDIIMVQNGNVILQDTTSKIVVEAGSVEARFMELYQR